jgi:pimeloyl-ACP methyl ester carboxylesterase
VAPGRISLRRHAAAVLRLIEAAELRNQTLILAGNSLGAAIAEMLALRKPDLIKNIVLIDGTFPGGPSNPGFLALARTLFSRKWYRAYRNRPEAAWASLYPYYAGLDKMPLEDREFLRQRVMARVESESQEKAFFDTQQSLVWTFLIASGRFTRKIRKWKGKILLIWGELDKILPFSSSEVFRTLREDMETAIIPGAGHLPHQEKPDETARIMINFADACTTGVCAELS